MARPTAVDALLKHPDDPAGYSAVAAVLNAAFDWPDGRVIDRRQIERWHSRRTLNQMGQAPPSPVRKRRDVPRTAPKVLFDPMAWVQWARAGVPARADPPREGQPGWRATGWVVPVEQEAPGE